MKKTTWFSSELMRAALQAGTSPVHAATLLVLKTPAIGSVFELQLAFDAAKLPPGKYKLYAEEIK